MSLQFLYGGSGSGKTEYIYQKIVTEAGDDPKKNYLVIVPEQFTMQTQKKLVELAPNHAIMNIDVLSFQRLAYRVFDELGKKDIRVLEETGKNLVLRRIAQEQEENLTILRSNMNRMGYIGEVKSMISELVQYNVSPDQLQKLTEETMLPSVLRAKLKDIVTMYRAFGDFMSGNYVTAEEILSVLRELVPDSEIIRDSVIVFDEFTGFTPIQKGLLKELLVAADRVYVTLTMDAGEDFYHCTGEEELFYLSKKTTLSMIKMAEELKVDVLEPVILSGSEKKRFLKAPALAFLEKNLFRVHRQQKKGEIGEIHLTVTKSPKDELTFIAKEINRLVREGYRYREIAVVTGSVETYQSELEPVFSKYGIPFFMDTTKEVLFHPFIEFIRATLEIISENYSYESVMRFLRCGFFPIEEDELDRLDNYLIASGIRGQRAWNRRWVYMPGHGTLFDLEKLEDVRKKIVETLKPVSRAFASEDACVQDGIVALYHLLDDLEVQKQLWEKEKELLEKGEQTRAKEYEQIYPVIMQLLEKYYHLLGEEKLTIDDFTEVFEAGLSAAKVAVIPPGYDSVTIGDIERTRLNHIRILFFTGVNDGVIPKAADAGGIISEYEREMLLASDVELAPGAREQAFIQRFYLYRNMTKPSEQLYISYSKVDTKGKGIRPSYLIGVLKQLFPDLKIREMEQMEGQKDFYTREAALDYLVYGEHDEAWYALAKWFLKGQDAKKARQLLLAGCTSYKHTPVSRAVALALYGRKLKGSVTRLERFAACAYAHYLQYGLRLQERDVSGLASVDIGNIYHMALECYSKKLERSQYDWFGVPDAIQEELCGLAIEEALAEYSGVGMQISAENRYQTKRMKEIFKQTVWALTRQVRAGKFIPKEFEISFSEIQQKQDLEYALAQDVHMQLTGRIDRIDTCQDENKMMIKVIDYKSGNTKFDLIRIFQGLQLQLLVYLNAAIGHMQQIYPQRQIDPAGIFYYHIDDPVIESDEELTGEAADHAILSALRPDGLVNSEESVYLAMDENLEGKSEVIPVELKKSGELSARSHVASTEEFEVLEDYVRLQIQRQGRAIYEGNIEIAPYQNGKECGCDYCPYASVCGFDGKIPGYRYRHPETPDKKEILDNMRTEIAKGENIT